MLVAFHSDSMEPCEEWRRHRVDRSAPSLLFRGSCLAYCHSSSFVFSHKRAHKTLELSIPSLFKRSSQVFDSRCRQTKANIIHWDQQNAVQKFMGGKNTKDLKIKIKTISFTILYWFTYCECSSPWSRVHFRMHLLLLFLNQQRVILMLCAWQKK